MKICPSCGMVNEDVARFCENCGTRLEGASVQTMGAAPPEEAPVQEAPRPQGQTDAQGQTPPRPQRQTDAQAQTPPRPQRQMGPQGQTPPRPQRQTGPQGQTPPRPQRQAGARMQAPPRKGIAAIHIAVLVEAVCLVLIIAAFFLVGRTRYSAQGVAEDYFKAYAAHDWEKVYGLMDLPDGDFLQEDQFTDTMERMELPEITNYVISEMPGVNEDIARVFHVEYSVKGQGVAELPVSAVKKSEKALFLFDQWKISAEGFITEGYTVTVPKGAQAAVDGVRLTEEYQVPSESAWEDTYQISLFNGSHTLSVTAPWCEVTQTDFDTSADSGTVVSILTPTKEGEAAFQAKMQEALETIFDAAIAGKDYSEVADLFASDAGEAYEGYSNEEYYNDMKEYLSSEPDDYYTLTGLQFEDFQCGFAMSGGVIAATMDFRYVVDYSYHAMFGGGSKRDTAEGETGMSAGFVYEDGTYKLQGISIPYSIVFWT